MSKPEGPFTLWVDYGYEGWAPYDYRTLEDAVGDVGNRGGHTWVITEAPVKLVQAKPVDIPSTPA